jgi:hypothetical protein
MALCGFVAVIVFNTVSFAGFDEHPGSRGTDAGGNPT